MKHEGVILTSDPHPYEGRYVIVRTWSAGVHAGVLEEVRTGGGQGDSVILRDSRRLWKWRARKGIALSGLAQNGIDVSESKVDTLIAEIYLTGVIEIIPASDLARESIDNA